MATMWRARDVKSIPLAVNRRVTVPDLRVPLLQAIELLKPLLQRKATDVRHSHRPIEPICRFASHEVEIAGAFFQADATFGEFGVDGFAGEGHAGKF